MDQDRLDQALRLAPSATFPSPPDTPLLSLRLTLAFRRISGDSDLVGATWT